MSSSPSLQPTSLSLPNVVRRRDEQGIPCVVQYDHAHLSLQALFFLDGKKHKTHAIPAIACFWFPLCGLSFFNRLCSNQHLRQTVATTSSIVLSVKMGMGDGRLYLNENNKSNDNNSNNFSNQSASLVVPPKSLALLRSEGSWPALQLLLPAGYMFATLMTQLEGVVSLLSS